MATAVKSMGSAEDFKKAMKKVSSDVTSGWTVAFDPPEFADNFTITWGSKPITVTEVTVDFNPVEEKPKTPKPLSKRLKKLGIKV